MRKLLCLISAALALGAPLTAQRTLTVPTPYATIQTAIDAATNDDTVLVAPGTYVENIDFLGKAITVHSNGGAAVTTIDGNRNGAVVRFANGEGRSSALDGFTITRGNGEPFGSNRYGGGIYCRDSSPTIIRNRVVSNGIFPETPYGSGIYCVGGAPLIRHNDIWNNGTNGGPPGGGILCDSRSSPEIRENEIRSNIGVVGGGIACIASSPNIVRNTIADNSSNDGAAIFGRNAVMRVVGNVIVWNQAFCGGALYCDSRSRATLVNNNMHSNHAYLNGGGIFVDSSFVSSTNDTIYFSGTRGIAGAVYAITSELFVTNGLIWQSEGGSGPWQVALFDRSYLSIDYSDVEDGVPGVRVDPTSTLQWGRSMLSADPKLLLAAHGAVRIGFDSPCRDRGRPGPNSPLIDFEGDSRTADAGIDIGADEFATRIAFSSSRDNWPYVQEVTVIGRPGKTAYLAVSPAGRLAPPMPLPGLFGALRLHAPITVVPLGPIPSSSAHELVTYIRNVPSMPLSIQALVGEQLTNAEVIRFP